jgi:putative FmdB family regulatory protein
MCQYVFHCRDCKKEFTLNLHMSDRGSSQVACPQCGGKQVEQLVTAFSAVTGKKS